MQGEEKARGSDRAPAAIVGEVVKAADDEAESANVGHAGRASWNEGEGKSGDEEPENEVALGKQHRGRIGVGNDDAAGTDDGSARRARRERNGANAPGNGSEDGSCAREQRATWQNFPGEIRVRRPSWWRRRPGTRGMGARRCRSASRAP